MAEPGKNGNGAAIRWVASVLAVLFTTAVIGIATFSIRTNASMETLRMQVSYLTTNVTAMGAKVDQLQADIHRLELQRERDLRGSQ